MNSYQSIVSNGIKRAELLIVRHFSKAKKRIFKVEYFPPGISQSIPFDCEIVA